MFFVTNFYHINVIFRILKYSGSDLWRLIKMSFREIHGIYLFNFCNAHAVNKS